MAGTHTLLSIVLFTVLLLTASGCGDDDRSRKDQAARSVTTAETSPDPGPPVPGGRIIEAMLGDATNLIPLLASDSASSEVADLIYVAPLRYDKDIQLECWAAESYEVLEDGRLLKFRLKPGIRWFDGVELTAEDVEFTYKLMIDPKTPTAYAEDFKAVSSFAVTGKYTFEVRYDEPFARALVTWAHSILPKHALKDQDIMNTKYSREPLGAGPYKLSVWEPGRRIALDVNEDYFEGRPYLDQVVYRIIPDLSTMFLELKAKNLDMMGLTPQQYLRQTTGPSWDRDYRKYQYLSFGYTFLGYNLQNPLFSDVRVRRALAHAIDKQEIVKGVLLGLGMPTIGPYKPGTWIYNDSIKDYTFDPAKAKSLFAEAGWTPGPDGILRKDGKPFAFTILTNQGNDQRVKTATIIQQRLKDVGIEVAIRTVEWAAFIKEFVEIGNFEAIIMAWTIPQDPDGFDVWHSSRAVPGGLNFVGFKNAEADALLEKGRHTLNQAERKKIYDAFQELLHREQPYCFLYAPYALPILSARFQGVAPAPAGISYNFTKWWVPKNLQTFSLTRQ